MTACEKDAYRSWVEIDLDCFRQNWEELRRITGPAVKILQVVKADAYGHGAVEIARAALENGAAYLGVANADEGVQLRVSGIDAPVVILSPSTGSEIDEILKYRLTPSVSDASFARELNNRLGSIERRRPVHIEIDTGMGRGGVPIEEATDFLSAMARLRHIEVEGIFSHLSSSEIVDEDYNLYQFRRFEKLLADIASQGVTIPMRHISNSGGVLNFPGFHLDMVRPGLMTYGIYPSPRTEGAAKLSPVMSFKSRIILLKEFPVHHSIGYGRTFVTKRPSIIATIPVGYGDGFGWLLSNQGDVLVGGKRAPVVGRISMDLCTIDVTDIPGIRLNDEVAILGRQGEEYISANEIAARAGTISYEILCALGKRAPRVFVNRGRADSVAPRLRRVFMVDEEKSIGRINEILRSCLKTRAHDADLGDAIYYEMFETLFGKRDRQLELRQNFRYDIRISEFSDRESAADFFRVRTRVSYRKVLRHERFIVACARDGTDLAELFEDERCEYRWLLGYGADGISFRDFTVRSVRIDGDEVPIISAGQTGRGYEIWCGSGELSGKIGREVAMEFEMETRQHRKNNLFSVYLVYPTRGLDVSFDYGDTAVGNVREVCFFAGKQPRPLVERCEGRSVSISVDAGEWIFPTSGVAFVWDK
ncbi:MAG: alanine racemase [Deltaproteobacteria bacterium]|nr:alanine racemase [Deltaproteobacteria bacterium]